MHLTAQNAYFCILIFGQYVVLSVSVQHSPIQNSPIQNSPIQNSPNSMKMNEKTVRYKTVQKTVPNNNCFNKPAGRELSFVQQT